MWYIRRLYQAYGNSHHTSPKAQLVGSSRSIQKIKEMAPYSTGSELTSQKAFIVQVLHLGMHVLWHSVVPTTFLEMILLIMYEESCCGCSRWGAKKISPKPLKGLCFSRGSLLRNHNKEGQFMESNSCKCGLIPQFTVLAFRTLGQFGIFSLSHPSPESLSQDQSLDDGLKSTWIIQS